MKKNKVLVFGANGLVGKSVVRTLTNSDKVETVISSTRKDTDLKDINAIKEAININQPDYVINCAAKVGGIYANNTYRAEFLLDNLKINLNLFDALKDYPNTSIINLGSSCIYPLNAPNPINEHSFLEGKLEPTNSPYAIAKITGIELGREIHNQYGNKILNLMPTNLYGPHDNFTDMNSHVIPGLIYRMQKAKVASDPVFEIWGSGKPLREFMFVDDLSSCIEYLIDKDIDSDLINVGTGEEVSILDLAFLVKEIIGYEGLIETDLDMPDGNPRKLLDSTLINSLGWKSKIDLKAGLKITYDWYIKNL
jgi:GDP-L-fucose synthase